MTIRLYLNSSPANYVNKTITQVGSDLVGYLREASSVVDPVITIERSDPTGFNYVYIPEFNRYYFVEGIGSDLNNLVSMSLHVDVLMTYQTQIASMRAVIKRQENVYNTYLDDGIYKAYQNPKHKIVKFPYGFTDFSYILALAGNGE